MRLETRKLVCYVAEHDCGHLLSALETITLLRSETATQSFLLEDDDPGRFDYEQQALGALVVFGLNAVLKYVRGGVGDFF